MDVFLVPVGADRHELYCEHGDVEVAPAGPGAAKPSIRQRIMDAFHRALHEGEEERRRRAADPQAPSPLPRGRVRRWIVTRIAEAVAEQRLLWHLRREPQVHVFYPDDLPEARAHELARASLQSDLEKHRLWCIIDASLAILCAPVALLPGPNLAAYYFLFRAVGHFLAMRGARHGLKRAAWDARPSAPLSTLRTALALDADARTARVAEVGAALGLDHLSAFVEGASARRS
jgi:Mitochondrial K+-H+ exchange-related